MKWSFSVVIQVLFLALVWLLMLGGAALAYVDFGAPTNETMPENRSDREEIFRIRIVNAVDGPITVSQDQGKTWVKVGKVVQPATKTNPNGYRASGWAETGAVAASASHAIHLKVDHNSTDPAFPAGHGVLISIIPREFYTPPEDFGGQPATDNGIYTNISAGTEIFGPWSPFVGDRLYLESNGNVYPVPVGYVPQPGDVLVLKVEQPKQYPSEIVFENRYGGLITVKYPQGREKIIGEVMRPVQGVGRFDAATATGLGGINTNHTGVITVSTVPFSNSLALDDQGGFQILPAYHANDDEMINARVLTQWMVVGPVNATDPSPEGTAPLFKHYIRPVYFAGDGTASFRTEVRIKNGDWQPVPQIAGRNDLGLVGVTHVRILFPDHLPAIAAGAPVTVLDPLPASVKATPIVVTGVTAPGAQVEVFVNGNSQGTVYATADGRFIFPKAYLVKGENLISAQATNAAEVTGPLSPAANVVLENVPIAPTLDPLPTPTKNPVVTLAGVAEPGTEVEILLNNVSRGTTLTDPTTGKFVVDQFTLQEGANTLVAVARYNSGEVSAPSEPVNVVLDTVRPIISQITPAFDSTVNTSMVTISAKVDGTGTPISYLAMKFDGNSVLPAYDATTGIVSYSAGPLANGMHSFAVYVQDQAGNAQRVPETGEGTFTVAVQ